MNKEKIQKEVSKEVMNYLENNIEWITFQTEGSLEDEYAYYKPKIVQNALNMCFELTYEKLLNNK